MARESYDQQLKQLKYEMMELGGIIEYVIRDMVKALLNQDLELAGKIAKNDDAVNGQVKKIEQKCYALLLKQQPIARDLRTVSAAIKMITDMERIGDHGADISELIILMGGQPYPKEINIIRKMADETKRMIIEAVNAFAQEDKSLAEDVIKRDDIVDELFVSAKESIAKSIKENDINAMQELDLLMVAKYFERIGDHATNIAEWVLFSLTGIFPEG